MSPVWSAVPIGVITAFCCNFSTKLKFYMNCDDGLDAFGLHGVGGYAGSCLTGIFAADYVATLDGVAVNSGRLDQPTLYPTWILTCWLHRVHASKSSQLILVFLHTPSSSHISSSISSISCLS